MTSGCYQITITLPLTHKPYHRLTFNDIPFLAMYGCIENPDNTCTTTKDDKIKLSHNIIMTKDCE